MRYVFINRSQSISKIYSGKIPGKVGKIMSKTMSVYAEKLSEKAEFAGKYARMNKETLGENFPVWKSTIVDCLPEAYKVYEARHNNGMSENVTIDTSALYTKVNAIRNLIGEVNGLKLNSALLAETMVGASHTTRKACFSNDSAAADCDLASAQASMRVVKARPVNATFTEAAKAQAIAKAQTAIDTAKARIDSLMQSAGNYRDVPCPVSESAFLSKVEVELRTIVNQQNAKTWEQVQAEKKALNEARKARRKSAK